MELRSAPRKFMIRADRSSGPAVKFRRNRTQKSNGVILLNIHRLSLLVELRRRGTVTEVARALSYSPSTISQQLKQLEREAATALFESVGRRVRLTGPGEMLADHAEQILVMLDRAETDLARSQSDIVGEIRVASFQTAAIALVPLLLDELNDHHPGITLYLSEIQPDAGTAALFARDFELVLGEIYPGGDRPPVLGIDRQHLLSDPLRCYAPPDWVGASAGLRDLADRPWVFEPQGKPARAWAESLCRAAGFEPNVRFESADLLVQVSLAESGHAAALLPDLVWGARTPSAQLLRLPGDPVREVYTAVRAGAEGRPSLAELRQRLGTVTESVTAALGQLDGAVPQKSGGR